ncbi:DUF3040 domain-containing protein [Jidongwangia harbinensis]|uniref:DUF3040 domain-containing protein n=1 Tax=Jidongwangia harbinensis TaxID=2878561 RepID=UPI001CD94905|nr:DUF3040 domain-containing protein [Jidongwangia harbinensis]MCA2213085.1 DUF3040 domain-containing protein [Jidongwangia harbinensis]
MLSKEHSRRLAQLERQLRHDDPDFCARMAGEPVRERVPLSVALAATVIWATALLLALAGWWIAATIAALWATVLVGALAYRCRPARYRPADSEPLPPAW